MKGFLASLMMLTRLPLWKIIKVDPRYYSDTLKYWPLVGFVTGFTTLGTYWPASLCMPLLPASVICYTLPPFTHRGLTRRWDWQIFWMASAEETVKSKF